MSVQTNTIGDAIPVVSDTSSRRVPAAERRDALISAAVHEFAQTGLHGTPVDRIARRVGVAQPYVFSLFANKRELFIAAVERGFERVLETFEAAAASWSAGESAVECEDALGAMGQAYVELLHSDRDYLLLQHQSYAACADEVVRDRVRHRYAELATRVRTLVGSRPRPGRRVLPQGHGPQRRGRARGRGALGQLQLGPGRARAGTD